MKKHLNIYPFILLALLIVAGCSDPPPQQYQSSSQPSSTQKTGPGQTETKTSQFSAWPFTDSQQVNVIVPNLLAKNYVLIFDGSGSMSESACNDKRNRSKINVAKQAVSEWIQTVPADANVGLVIFSNGWTILDAASGSRETFKQTVSKISPDGFTPLASAFMASYNMLTKQAQSQLGYGEYTIVAITDGADNDRSESLERWVKKILGETPINIYTIGFCIGSRHELNQPGKMVYREAGNIEEIRKGLAEVMAESETFDVTQFPK